jgi:3-dehydroquinate synthetase
VEQRLELLLMADPMELVPVAAAAAAAKIAVVERDPTEQGDRRLLNFGHTLGHAIESACGYSGIRHGEAVGYGILFALRLALRQGLDPAFARRVASLLRRFDLPPLPRLDAESLIACMAKDKKALESGLVWVLPAAPGEGRMVSAIPPEVIEAELAAFLIDPFAKAPAFIADQV